MADAPSAATAAESAAPATAAPTPEAAQARMSEIDADKAGAYWDAAHPLHERVVQERFELQKLVTAASTPKPEDPAAVEREAALWREYRAVEWDSDEQVRVADKINAGVLAQPSRDSDVAEAQKLALALPLPGDKTWSAQKLARGCTVLRANLGESAVSRDLPNIMGAFHQAAHDAATGTVYSWAGEVAKLKEKWGDGAEQDFLEAVNLVPREFLKELLPLLPHPAVVRVFTALGRAIGA